MSDLLERTMHEDRLLRDAARALVDADLANLRANYAARGISTRIKERVSDGAAEVLDEAIAITEDHKGVVATLIAAIVLWLARHPVIALLTDADGETEERDPSRNR